MEIRKIIELKKLNIQRYLRAKQLQEDYGCRKCIAEKECNSWELSNLDLSVANEECINFLFNKLGQREVSQ